MLYLIVLTLLDIWGCVEINKSESENLYCVISIDKKSDITPKTIEHCSKLASVDNFIGYLCLCRINRINSKIDLAVNACSKAKIKNPFSPYPHIEFAHIYTTKNKTDIALTEVEFALSIDSHNFHANLLAGELSESKNLHKSLKYYTNALDILKNSNQPYVIGKKTYIESKIKTLKQKIEKKRKEDEEAKYLNCIKEYKSEDDPQSSVKIIETCLSMRQKHNPMLYIDYIKALYRAERYDEVIGNKYLKLIPEKNMDEINIILADSYYKKGKFDESVKYYKKALSEKPDDIHLLLKYAEALEKNKDKITALEVYQRINSIKSSPSIEEKIDDLKIEVMSESEILEDLKLRGFVEKDKVVLLPPDRKVFLSVKLVERKGGIKYLRERYPGYSNLIWENPSNPQDVRITATGYFLYLRHISQIFIRAIEKEAQDPREIFKVRDRNGFDIFDKNGRLTYEGLKCYYDYEKHKKKNWYFQNEILPLTKQKNSYLDEKKADDFAKKKKELEKIGYEEISETEYLWLTRATNCPEDVLLSPPCDIKKLDSGNGFRYFLCMKSDMCNHIQKILSTYIASYRSGNTDIADTQAASNFFGRPGSPKRRFCENGRIWDGK